MITVKVDGSVWGHDLGGINSMPDLIEFIKANIDPEKIITTLLISGRDLSEVDWRVPLSVQGDSTLEVTTDSQRNYVTDRLMAAQEYAEYITNEFAVARESFQNGKTEDGNRGLSRAVNDLNAFLAWYGTVLQMLPEDWKSYIENFTVQVEGLSKICEQILQQQLYQSWWAVGETVQNELEPRLTNMKSACGMLSKQWG